MTDRIKAPAKINKALETREAEDTQLLKSEIEQLKKAVEEARKETSELQEKLEGISNEKLPGVIKDLGKWWLSPYEIRVADDCVGIVDPIYGYITIEQELIPLLMHPLIQRLNFVRQLSFSYLEFPTAQHTRLAHSLGVCKNAELALDAIFRGKNIFFLWRKADFCFSRRNQKPSHGSKSCWSVT